MMGHRDSNPSAKNAETSLAQKARLNFESIVGEGIQLAREVHDPTARAHRLYQEGLTRCLQFSPGVVNGRSIHEWCLDNLDKFKQQMQEEGT